MRYECRKSYQYTAFLTSFAYQREMDRLDLTHTMIVKTIGNKFFLAPIKAEVTHRILDVGTGTGICGLLF